MNRELPARFSSSDSASILFHLFSLNSPHRSPLPNSHFPVLLESDFLVHPERPGLFHRLRTNGVKSLFLTLIVFLVCLVDLVYQELRESDRKG
jgi:hypothetical protein